jgi:hypothetical protein
MIDVDRLLKAMHRSQEQMEPFRLNRRLALEQFVGGNYSRNGSPVPVPMNLISLYVQTVSRAIVPKAPQIMVTTQRREYRPTVESVQRWGNKEIDRIGLERTFRRWAIDGLFSLGMLKVGLATPADSSRFAWRLKAGKAFAECVSIDDLVFDANASTFDEVTFIGHRFRVPLEVVKDRSMYNKNRLKLEAASKQTLNTTGDERASAIGNDRHDDEDFEDHVALWEVYLPRHNIVLTIADAFNGAEMIDDTRVLREQQWIGPESGPYHPLGFGIVPDNPMPKSPIMDLMDMHLFTNEAVRKIFNQTRRSKKLLVVQGSDGDTYKNAQDGEIVSTAMGPQGQVEIEQGGASEKVQMAAVWGYQMGKELAGNLDATAGLNAQSKTATQDKMLTETASAGLADMQSEMVNASARALKSLCWYWHHDPDLVMVSEIKIGELSDTSRVDPMKRLSVPWDELDIKVSPYSMQFSSPQQKASVLNAIMSQIIIPLAPMLQQQGIQPNMDKFLDILSRLQDMPEIQEILGIGEPSMNAQSASGPAMPSAPTERRYIRENISERTSKGDAQNMMNQLMGVDPGGDPRQGGQ